MPPVPDASLSAVVAPMLPVTAIVGPLSAMLPAVSLPATPRLPVSTKRKSPPVTANDPTETMVFAVPARLTVPVTPEVLCRTVLATIVPVDTCVTPPPDAERSTVAPDRMPPVFSEIPPEPDVRISAVVAPMLPVTLMVPVLASWIVTLPAVTGPVTDRLPVLPLSTSVKLPDPTPKDPNAPMLLDVEERVTPLAAVPLRVPTVSAPAVPAMEPSVSKFRVPAIPVRLTAAARVILAAVIATVLPLFTSV